MIEGRASDQAIYEAMLTICPGSYIKNRKLYEARHARYKNNPEYKRSYEVYIRATPPDSSCGLGAMPAGEDELEKWIVVPKETVEAGYKAERERDAKRKKEHEEWLKDPNYPVRLRYYCSPGPMPAAHVDYNRLCGFDPKQGQALDANKEGTLK
jgi:hypothetical protein